MGVYRAPRTTRSSSRHFSSCCSNTSSLNLICRETNNKNTSAWQWHLNWHWITTSRVPPNLFLGATMSNLQHRFFDPDSLERLFAEREISRHRVIDSPRCEITIDPIHEEIALTAPAEGAEPDVSKFSRISFAVLGDGSASEFEVRVDATDAHFEAYN